MEEIPQFLREDFLFPSEERKNSSDLSFHSSEVSFHSSEEFFLAFVGKASFSSELFRNPYVGNYYVRRLIAILYLCRWRGLSSSIY